MIFCRDCKHCDLGKNSTPPPQWPLGRALHYRCHFDSGEIDCVSGNRINTRPETCHEMRGAFSPCGPDAKLFEARATP